MIFKIQMKDPDGVFDSIRDAAKRSLELGESISREEGNLIIESRREKLNEDVKKWITCGEYLTIEIDTDKMTATVLEAKP